MKLQFVVSTQTNPYLNIAVENYLVGQPSAQTVTMYLWRNRRTVVIGQNQNPYSECDVAALEADGGYLMRRRTGGGAVYHDDGNINFSFVAPPDLYDQRRQFTVIQHAVESFGLHTSLSGRNDIMVEDGEGALRKFSGNAFSRGQHNNLHHGTILIRGNMADLQRYLKPKPAKLLKHGVSSVQSRVVNLGELNPAITSESIAPRLREAFCADYGREAAVEQLDFDTLCREAEVQRLYAEFASPEWKYGRWQTFNAQRSAQFDWGMVDLSVEVADGRIADIQVATDALELDAIDHLRTLVTGQPLDMRPPATGNAIVDDMIGLIF